MYTTICTIAAHGPLSLVSCGNGAAYTLHGPDGLGVFFQDDDATELLAELAAYEATSAPGEAHVLEYLWSLYGGLATAGT